jgi:hypothetical protein
MIDAELIARARDFDIVSTAERLGASLKRATATERVGPCPKCGVAIGLPSTSNGEYGTVAGATKAALAPCHSSCTFAHSISAKASRSSPAI